MTMLESRLPDFPVNPEDGFQIREELPDGGYVIWTYSGPYNQWTYEQFTAALSGYIYTDQVLTRAKGSTRDGEPELLTQQDVNHYLDAKEGGGGGNVPGKESKPWIQINSWGMRRSPYGGSPIYECSWNCNSNAIYSWQYEIDVDGDNNWVDIAEHPQKNDLGFSPGGEFPNQLTLANTAQEERYPNALMRYRITAELNSIKNELSSGAIAAWEVRHDEYDPPLYEDGTAVDLEPYATTEYVDEKVEEYLPLTGGTIEGNLAYQARPNSCWHLCFSCKADGLEDGKQVAFRVTAMVQLRRTRHRPPVHGFGQ